MGAVGDIGKQHVHRKQVNEHETYTRTMCKHSALSVCPTSGLPSAEARTCAQLLSPCRQWASPGGDPPRGLCWAARVQPDIWTAQEAIIPIR